MVEKDHSRIPLKRQAEMLFINRTGLYYKPVDKSEEEISLMHAIDRISVSVKKRIIPIPIG